MNGQVNRKIDEMTERKKRGKSLGDTHILMDKELEAQRMNTNREKGMNLNRD